MTKGNEQSVANAPIEPTPKAKGGVKLHDVKFDYYANPTKGDSVILSWPQCEVVFCPNEEEFIEVMRALYARLAAEAQKRVAETGETATAEAGF